jgi:BolA protein
MNSLEKMGTVEQRIRNKIQNTFSPPYFEVVNESFKHNVPKGSETHFKVCLECKPSQQKRQLFPQNIILVWLFYEKTQPV